MTMHMNSTLHQPSHSGMAPTGGKYDIIVPIPIVDIHKALELS